MRTVEATDIGIVQSNIDRSPTGSPIPAGALESISCPDAVIPASVRPKVVVVLGMHRSGTSLLAGILRLLGVDMGDQLEHRDPTNPTGYWERREIVGLHEFLLTALKREIGNPQHLLSQPPGWLEHPVVRTVQSELRRCLELGQRDGARLWGFKDPRTARFLPLWQPLFEEMELEPIYLWAMRSPAASAESMIRKNPRQRPMTETFAEIMWAAYNVEIYKAIRNSHFTVMDYDRWFREPEAALEELRRALAVPVLSPFKRDAIQTLIHQEHRHHQALPEAGQPQFREFYRAITANPPDRSAIDAAVAWWPLAETIMQEFMRPAIAANEQKHAS